MKKFIGSVVLPGILLTMVAAAQDNSQNNSQNSRTNGFPEAQYTAEGSERCLRCHAGERMTLMAETVHGNPENPQTPWAQHGCESCHGPGSLHASRARGGRGFPSLVTFQDDEPIEKKTQACISCHGKDMGELQGKEWTGTAHEMFGMTCTICHELHVVGNPLTDQKRQRQVCEKCHDNQVANHPQFEDKGIVFDRLSCSDCHDMHQLKYEP